MRRRKLDMVLELSRRSRNRSSSFRFVKEAEGAIFRIIYPHGMCNWQECENMAANILRMVVLNSGVKAERNHIPPGVLDPCKRPGGPHLGCNGDVKSPPQPANPYNRGCSMILRCRSGHDKGHNHKGQ
ncbi:hypothetical protein TB2_007487 [Malus domestica]